MIRDGGPADGRAIADIYNYYIQTTVISFEEAPVAASEMSRRIGKREKASALARLG